MNKIINISGIIMLLLISLTSINAVTQCTGDLVTTPWVDETIEITGSCTSIEISGLTRYSDMVITSGTNSNLATYTMDIGIDFDGGNYETANIHFQDSDIGQITYFSIYPMFANPASEGTLNLTFDSSQVYDTFGGVLTFQPELTHNYTLALSDLDNGYDVLYKDMFNEVLTFGDMNVNLVNTGYVVEEPQEENTLSGVSNIITELFGVVSTLITEVVTIMTGDLLVLVIVGAFITMIVGVIYLILDYIKKAVGGGVRMKR